MTSLLSKITSLHLVNSVELHFTAFVELTPCQKKKKEALKLPPLGSFVPQCKSDGSFKEKQCYPSTGQCWCVDKNGREIEKTRTRRPLNCSRSGREPARTIRLF